KTTLKPDVVAVDGGELYAIEVKSTNRSEVHVPREQVERLLEFTKMFVVKCPSCGRAIRPKPVIAVRFLGRGWVLKEVDEQTGSIVIKTGG
ncbi:MAG: hypothetical protein NZ733_01765, partial [Aigarchaeota archaeon]|nr:hypothetical protein [Aigarchaeota archaeon]